MHERSALQAREDGGVELLAHVGVARHDHAAARTAQGLVRRCRAYVGVRNRVGIGPARHKAGEVGHVHQQIGADLICDLAEGREVDGPRIGRSPCDDHLRPDLTRLLAKLVVIDERISFAHAVMMGFEPLTRHVRTRAMGQVAAGRQVETENPVARLEQREKDRLVGLAPGIGLHVGVGRAEKLFGPVDRQIFGQIDELAAAVVALAGIAFGVLVGQGRALGFQHGARDDVLRCDQLDLGLLTPDLLRDRIGEFRIGRSERAGEEAVGGFANRGVGHGAAPSCWVDPVHTARRPARQPLWAAP